jgi:putative hydrolase of the HAD superfamily
VRITHEALVKGDGSRRAHRPRGDSETRRIAAVIFDFGDTLADETTEEKDSHQVTQRARLFPGARNAVLELHQQGHVLGLLADCCAGTGRASYDNVLRQHRIGDLFTSVVTSDDAGVVKPHPRMFELILRALAIPDEDEHRVVMVGNRLDRDVKGANQAGLVSVWCRLSERYATAPKDESEVPRHAFSDFARLPGLIKAIEDLQGERVTGWRSPS